MITPYPPPQGPRVELLRVRRVYPTAPIEPSRPSPLPDPGDLAQSDPVLVERMDFSTEALRLLARDLQENPPGGKP